MTRLAEVYVEHDMAPEALDLYEKALKLAPDNTAVQKGMGATLERLHRDAEAQEMSGSRSSTRRRRSTIGRRSSRRASGSSSSRSAPGELGILAGQYREQALQGAQDRRSGSGGVHAARRRCAGEDGAHRDGRGALARARAIRRARASCAPMLAGPGAGRARAPRLNDAVAALKKAAELVPERGARALSADRRAVAAAVPATPMR